MQFINHNNHKTKNKEECRECIKELQALKEEYLSIEVDNMVELQFHKHNR